MALQHSLSVTFKLHWQEPASSAWRPLPERYADICL